MTEEVLKINLPEKDLNHYETLGIRLFETDIRIIHEAGFKRFTECNNLLEESQSLNAQRSGHDFLKKLSKACTTLENPEKKENYDQLLANELNVDLAKERRITVQLKNTEEEKDEPEENKKSDSRLLDLKKPQTSATLRLAKKKKSSDKDSKEKTQKIEEFRNKKPKLLGPEKTIVIFPDPPQNTQEKNNEAILRQGNTTFTMLKCENCGELMSQWAALCIECGYDRRTQKITQTRKFKRPPPRKFGTGIIKRTAGTIINNTKKAITALLTFSLLIFTIFACVMFILKIISKKDFVVDSNKTIVSGDWKKAMKKSKFWITYFEHRNLKGDPKPYVKLSLKTEVKNSSTGLPLKIYSIKITDIKSNELLYENNLAMDFNPNIAEKIEEKSKMIKEVMDDAAKHVILKRAKKYPELFTGDWDEDSPEGLKGAVIFLKKAIEK